MGATEQVELQRYHPGHAETLKTFSLPKEQEQFTSLPIHLLEVSDIRHPIVIVHNHEPVGFFVLHASERVKEYTDNPNAMLLTSFSINYPQQGRGFAKKGLEQIKPFARKEFPWCNEIVLAVNRKNIAAQKLYRKVGYQDTGRRRMGPIGEQIHFFVPSFGRCGFKRKLIKGPSWPEKRCPPIVLLIKTTGGRLLIICEVARFRSLPCGQKIASADTSELSKSFRKFD
mgnify:CR=1 FL=1